MKQYADLFPGNPFSDLQKKLLKYPTDKEESTFTLDILRNLDVLTDYIRPGKIIHSVEDFPFIKLLEDNFAIIKREFAALNEHLLVSWPEKYLCKKGWDVFGLFAFKNRLVENCDRCPETTKLLEQIPGPLPWRRWPLHALFNTCDTIFRYDDGNVQLFATSNTHSTARRLLPVFKQNSALPPWYHHPDRWSNGSQSERTHPNVGGRKMFCV